MTQSPFGIDVTPHWQALVDCLLRKGTPARVHYMELFLDGEIQQEIARRYGVWDGIEEEDEFADLKRHVAMQRALGYDYVRCGVEDLPMPMKRATVDDTSEELTREAGRSYMEEHEGPITNWDEFHAYPWPDPHRVTTRALDWYSEELPDDMCIIGSGGFAHFAEWLTWLMGYETLCYALYDQRDLVEAIATRCREMYEVILPKILAYDRVKIVWGSDDMGHKTGTLISPDDMGEFILPGHKLMAKMSHDAGRPYLLHACGNLSEIMDDLIDDVRIDAKHSFEDTIESVVDCKALWGDRIALIGGIDLDFLCRAAEADVRRRVKITLEACMEGGGYCLGTGNSVANYIPLDNYLAMLDEGRKWQP